MEAEPRTGEERLPVNQPGAGRQPLLQGKRALITGASRGIGLAVAQAFAREEAHLVLSARDQEALVNAAKSCTSMGAGSVHIIPADCSNHEDVERLASTALSQFGDIHILVNNAGKAVSSTRENILEDSPLAWHDLMAVNLLAPMTLTRRLAPGMVERKEGCIINVASFAATEAIPSHPAYAASKWGLRGWSRSIFMALRTSGVKVVCVCPGFTDTDLVKDVPGSHEHMMRPEDVAEAVMLAVRMSPNATPEEIIMRPTWPV